MGGGEGGLRGSKSVYFLPLAPDTSGVVGRLEINAEGTMLRGPGLRVPVSAPGVSMFPVTASESFCVSVAAVP